MLITPLLLGLACGGTHPACTCFPGPPLTSRAAVAAVANGSAAVFEGTVVRAVHPGPGPGAPVPDLVVTLAVRRQWKGAPAKTITVRTAPATESCGVRFVEGRTYVVFAGTPDYSGVGVARPARAREVVYANKCSPTTAVGAESQRIVSLLGPPLAAGAAAPPSDGPEA